MFLNPAAIGNGQKTSISDPKLINLSSVSLTGERMARNNPVVALFDIP
jgi:ABC-type Fe2+-enterobactin transport system substrate-binding protein